ncbi:MAG TPA: glycosyltransferase family 2 protein [Candidatus Cybelea sp.]|nr:glycosyltransferase family 2 protein [Candidatus Cybelea sp.]
MPAVSVIIAALEAEDFLGEAVDSVLAQSFGDFEIVIAPDEPRDYGRFAARDSRIRVLPGVPAPTGPGPARNRALATATGDWIALLDADDLWSPNYLAALLPQAETAGAAFGRTSVLDTNDRELRSIPPSVHYGSADFRVFEHAFGSFHALARRTPDRRWRDILAEDVLFDLESLALAGGTAPYVSASVYTLRRRAHSATRRSAFIDNIDAQYRRIIETIERGETMIGSPHRAAAVAVIESWVRMNAGFLTAAATTPGLEYQNYIFSLKL